MDFSVDKNVLLDGVQVVQSAITQKSSLPILSNVLLEIKNEKLELTATDLDIGICANIKVDVKEKGAITIPAKKFFDIVRSLPDNSIIEVALKKNNSIIIKGERAQFKIIGLPKEEFPQLPVFKDKDIIVMKQKELKNILNLTDFAISKDDTRYILNGIFLSIKGDRVDMVATDGRRLAAATKILPEKTMLEKEVVVPIKTIQEVKRLLLDEGDIKIQFGENQIMFSFPTSFIISRLIEGEYPNYKKVIPQKSKKEVKVNRDEFLSAARRASIFTDQDSLAIKLDIQKNKMTISKNTPYLGESKEQIDIMYTGDDTLEIGFNPKYLIDVLKNLEEQEVSFEVSDASKPGVIRKGEEYTYVVLPMQLNA